jgi:hypothetical protein
MTQTRRKKTAQFKLLLEPALHSRIVRAAKRSNRTLNGEIEWRLQQSFGVTLQITSMDLANSWVEANARIMALEKEYGDGAYAKGLMERYIKEAK